MVPHVGETDTDVLTEIPGRPAEAEEEKEGEEKDEFGYSWSKFIFFFSSNDSVQHLIKRLFRLIRYSIKCNRCVP